MIISKTVTLTWNKNIKRYYTNLGYKFTFYGDNFLVPIEHLPKSSRAIIQLLCDYCNITVIERDYNTINKLYKKKPYNTKHCCGNKECIRQKTKESNNKLYGVDYANQNNEIQKRYEDSIEQKYGVRNVAKLDVVKEKVKQTSLEKYGAEHYQQSEFAYRESDMHHFQRPDVIKKIQDTMLQRYGVTSSMKSDLLREKILISRAKSSYINGKGVPSPRQQTYLCNLLNGELNYSEGTVNMDIAFPFDKVYIEYNGTGHWLSIKLGKYTEKEFNLKEQKRYYFLKSKGWKLISIVSSKNDKLPSDEVLITLIEESKQILQNNHSWIEINIDESKLKCSEFEKVIDLGTLRKIKENDVIKSSTYETEKVKYYEESSE